VSAPKSRGFGSDVIERYAASELGGETTMDFAPDGMRVTLTAPLERIAGEAPRRPPGGGGEALAAAETISRSLRVLVVEDSALIAVDLASLLEDGGHVVIGPASTVSEALALIDEAAIDAALLDVNLDGEFSGSVAEALAARGVPFAVVTGFDDAVLAGLGFAGVPVLQKPFDDVSIKAVLASLICPRPTGPATA
jgi:two-component system, chemotaxis family, sensor kinase Cph1